MTVFRMLNIKYAQTDCGTVAWLRDRLGALCIGLLVSVSAAAQAAPTILVVGDSLSAAYGISDEQGWVNLLRDRLDAEGYPHRVVNASVSGDTTRDAVSRIDTTLERHQPDIVIVELGGNDGLRAFSVEAIRDNLARILKAIRENGAKIVLAGIRIPSNYGPAYTGAFEQLYPDLAEQFDAALIPFFMEDVATQPSLMQDDGIHPTADAQPILLDNVWGVLEPLLKQSAAAAEAPPSTNTFVAHYRVSPLASIGAGCPGAPLVGRDAPQRL